MACTAGAIINLSMVCIVGVNEVNSLFGGNKESFMKKQKSYGFYKRGEMMEEMNEFWDGGGGWRSRLEC